MTPCAVAFVNVVSLESIPRAIGLRIVADRDAMSKYGVTPGTLAEALDVAFYGEPVSQVLEGQRAFDLVVRFDEEHRGSTEKIRNAVIDTPLGAKVELAWLADIAEDRGPNTVSRENVQRKIVVQSNVSGRDVASVNSARESKRASTSPRATTSSMAASSKAVRPRLARLPFYRLFPFSPSS